MKLLKITRSSLHESYVLSISPDNGNTWEIYDMYAYGGVPTAYSYDFDKDFVNADILSDIAKLVNDGYIFSTAVVEDVN